MVEKESENLSKALLEPQGSYENVTAEIEARARSYFTESNSEHGGAGSWTLLKGHRSSRPC